MMTKQAKNKKKSNEYLFRIHTFNKILRKLQCKKQNSDKNHLTTFSAASTN